MRTCWKTHKSSFQIKIRKIFSVYIIRAVKNALALNETIICYHKYIFKKLYKIRLNSLEIMKIKSLWLNPNIFQYFHTINVFVLGKINFTITRVPKYTETDVIVKYVSSQAPTVRAHEINRWMPNTVLIPSIGRSSKLRNCLTALKLPREARS